MSNGDGDDTGRGGRDQGGTRAGTGRTGRGDGDERTAGEGGSASSGARGGETRRGRPDGPPGERAPQGGGGRDAAQQSAGGARQAAAGGEETAPAGAKQPSGRPDGPAGGGEGGAQGGRDGDEGSSGISWGMGCLGCGCLLVLLATCSGVATFVYASYQTAQFARNIKEGAEVRQEVQRERRTLVEETSVREILEEPLEASDFRALRNTVDDWKQSGPFQHLEELQRMEEEQGQDLSTYEQMQRIYTGWSFVSSVHELAPAYVEAMENNGGIATHYRRLLRIGAVYFAVSRVAADNRFDVSGDAVSDEAARYVYENRPKIVRSYQDRLDRFKGKEVSINELSGRKALGPYAIASTPRASFGAWLELSEEERKKVVEAFGWSLAAETLTFGGLPHTFGIGNKLPIEPQ